MQQTLKQRSALVRAAEYAHNQRPRPVSADEIVMAVYNHRQAIRGGRIALVAVLLVVLWGVVG